MEEGIRDVVILGSGCAGLTSAIYASRAALSPLVIEGPEPGGQLSLTSLVENYPGFVEGIEGPALMQSIRDQAVRFGAEISRGTIDRVDLSKEPFSLFVEGREVRASTIIIATGATARLLGLESEKRLLGKGVSTCATCDGFFYRDEEIVVVGGGDSALEEAIFLTKFASKVTIIHRRDELRGSQILQQRAHQNSRITFRWNAVPHEFISDEEGGVVGVDVEDVKTGEISRIDCKGAFIAIGHIPNTDVFKDQLKLDDDGYIVAERDIYTSREGVFAAGDVADRVFKQAITAAGAGCKAAIAVERYLQEKGKG